MTFYFFVVPVQRCRVQSCLYLILTQKNNMRAFCSFLIFKSYYFLDHFNMSERQWLGSPGSGLPIFRDAKNSRDTNLAFSQTCPSFANYFSLVIHQFFFIPISFSLPSFHFEIEIQKKLISELQVRRKLSKNFKLEENLWENFWSDVYIVKKDPPFEKWQDWISNMWKKVLLENFSLLEFSTNSKAFSQVFLQENLQQKENLQENFWSNVYFSFNFLTYAHRTSKRKYTFFHGHTKFSPQKAPRSKENYWVLLCKHQMSQWHLCTTIKKVYLTPSHKQMSQSLPLWGSSS